MEAQASRSDATDKTLILGPLDLFPATKDRLAVADLRVHTARLAGGAAVSVLGASVVPDRAVRHDEEQAFVLGPSWSLKVRRSARAVLAGGPRAALAELRALAPYERAARAALYVELQRAHSAATGVVTDLRRVDGVQRRTAAGAFLAGVVVSSIVAWIA
jgi:hypothetical protein